MHGFADATSTTGVDLSKL